MKTWTEAEIREGLQNQDAWVKRALLVLYEFQSPEERKERKNLLKDGAGFDSADVATLTSFVVFYQKYHYFTNHQIQESRKRLLKYAGQLVKLANAKEELKRPNPFYKKPYQNKFKM